MKPSCDGVNAAYSHASKLRLRSACCGSNDKSAPHAYKCSYYTRTDYTLPLFPELSQVWSISRCWAARLWNNLAPLHCVILNLVSSWSSLRLTVDMTFYIRTHSHIHRFSVDIHRFLSSCIPLSTEYLQNTDGFY